MAPKSYSLLSYFSTLGSISFNSAGGGDAIMVSAEAFPCDMYQLQVHKMLLILHVMTCPHETNVTSFFFFAYLSEHTTYNNIKLSAVCI